MICMVSLYRLNIINFNIFYKNNNLEFEYKKLIYNRIIN